MAVPTPAKWIGKGTTAANPRLIESVADYEALFQYPVMEDYKLGLGDRDGYYYKLTADLDLLNIQRYPLGNMVKGSDGKGGVYSQQIGISIKLDGDGHTITNGNWAGGTFMYGGLISLLGSAGSVSNLHVTSSSASGYYDSGGFVGYNDGTITACSVTSSSSSAPYYSGGFVGLNQSGTITACSVTLSSSSASAASAVSAYSGGFVARNSGTITACSVTSSSSSASGNYYSGGFVCYNTGGTIRNCFAACTLGSKGTRRGFCALGSLITPTANFWDTDYNIPITHAEVYATGVTTIQAKAGDTSPINGLSTGSGAGYWYYKSGEYPRLVPFFINVNILCTIGISSGAGVLILVNGEVTPLKYLSGNFTFINGALQAISENNFPSVGIFGLGLRESGMVSFSGAAAGQFSVSLDGVNYASSVYAEKGPSQIYIKYTPSGAVKATARLLTPY